MLTFFRYGGRCVAILRPGPERRRPGPSRGPRSPARAAPARPLHRCALIRLTFQASLAWAEARRGRVRCGDKAVPRVRPPPISALAIMGQMIHFNLAISPEGVGTGGAALGPAPERAAESAGRAV